MLIIHTDAVATLGASFVVGRNGRTQRLLSVLVFGRILSARLTILNASRTHPHRRRKKRKGTHQQHTTTNIGDGVIYT